MQSTPTTSLRDGAIAGFLPGKTMRPGRMLSLVASAAVMLLGGCEQDRLAAVRLQGGPEAVEAQWRDLRDELRKAQERYSVRMMDHAHAVASGDSHAMPRAGSALAATGIGAFSGRTVAEVIDLMRQRELEAYRAAREAVLREQDEWRQTMTDSDALVSQLEMRDLRLQQRSWTPPANGVSLPAGPRTRARARERDEEVVVVEGTVVNRGTRTVHNLMLQLSAATDAQQRGGRHVVRVLLPDPLQPGEARALAVPLWELSSDALADTGGTLALTGQVVQADLAENGSGRYLQGERSREQALGDASFALRLAVLDRRLRQLEAGWTVPMTPRDEPSAFASPLDIDRLRDGAAACGTDGAELAAATFPGRTALAAGAAGWSLELFGKDEQVSAMLLSGSAPVPDQIFGLLDCIDALVYVERPSTPLMGLAELVAETALPRHEQPPQEHEYATGSARFAVVRRPHVGIEITVDQLSHARKPIARQAPGPARLRP